MEAVKNIDQLLNFIEFEKKQKREDRGEQIMYDIKGCHKYLTFSELFEWYIKYY